MLIEGTILEELNPTRNPHNASSNFIGISGYGGFIRIDRKVFPDLDRLLLDVYVRIEAEQQADHNYVTATSVTTVPYDTMVGRDTEVKLEDAQAAAEQLRRAGYRVLVHPARAESRHHKQWWGERQASLQEKRAWLHIGNDRSEVFAAAGAPICDGPTDDMIQYLQRNYPPADTAAAFLHQGTLTTQDERDYVERAQRPSWHTRKTT